MTTNGFAEGTRGYALRVMAILLLVLVARPVTAQPSLDVSFGRAMSSLNQAADSESRQTTAASVEGESRFAGERLRLFYDLEAGTFNTPGDWTYYLHTAGATWRTTRAGSSGPTLFAGGSFAWRSNGASWAAADYRAVGVFSNVEWRPRPAVTVRGGYRLDARDFPESPELNQLEHHTFGSLLANLPSRTTLIGEIGIGAKSYTTPVVQAIAAASVPSPAGSTQAARWHGMGPGYRSTTVSGVGAANAEVPADGHAGLITVTARIAQSLADRTAVSLQFTERAAFGALPTAIVWTPALFFDDGIYDDPFASQARMLRGTLKHLLAGGAELEATSAWMRKDYRGTPALALDGLVALGAPLRGDRIWRTGASWTMPMFPSRTGPVGLDLVIDYRFTRHRSNDAFYNYASHAVGLGVKVSY
jgi:hypothetical protein